MKRADKLIYTGLVGSRRKPLVLSSKANKFKLGAERMIEKNPSGNMIIQGVVSFTSSVTESTVIVDTEEGIETLGKIIKNEYTEGQKLRIIIMPV